MPTPVINNVLRSNVNKYALNFIPKSQTAAAYALRRLRSSYTGYPLRIRDDTGTENDIPFCGENLCTGTMLNWLQRNQVASIPLGVDANANGVSDGWSNANDAGITATLSINDSAQKIEITNSTTAARSYVYKDVTLIAGNIVNMNVTYKVSSNVTLQFWIDWYTSVPAYISSSTFATGTSSTYASASNNSLTAPSNAAFARVRIGIKPNTSGDTGSVWFKDASVTISNQSSYVSTWYDQSGNNNHAVQTTAANQPRLVNAGVLVTDNGKPAIETILASDTHFVVNDNNTLDFTTNASFSIVHNPNSLGEGSGGRIISKSTDIELLTASTTKFTLSGISSLDSVYTLSSQNINTITADSVSNKTKFYINGVLNRETTRNAFGENTNNMYILNRADGARQYDGKISELILFGTTLNDSQRSKLEKSQGTYYGVTVA